MAGSGEFVEEILTMPYLSALQVFALVLGVLLIPPAGHAAQALQAGVPVSQAQTAHWYDPGRDGEGWSLEILDNNQALAYWFTYDEQGNPRWLLGTGEVIDDRIEFPELVVTHGGRFGPDFDPEDVVREVVGSAVMHFHDCDSGQVEFNAFDQQLTVALSRLSTTMGLECTSSGQDGDESLAWQSGSWYDPAQDGQGLTLQRLAGGAALVTWFSYDSAGEQYWMQGVGEANDHRLIFPDMYATRGPAFGAGFDGDELEIVPWGELTLELGCDAGLAEFESVLPEFGQGTLELDRLTFPDGLECAPLGSGGPDFDQASWEVIAENAPRLSELPAVAIGEYIYMGGGMTSLQSSVTEFWRYQTTTGQWTRLADLPERRDHAMMAALDGYIFYFGGYGSVLAGPTDTTWRYDPGSNSWSTRAPMPSINAAGGAAALGEHIYVAGGIGTRQTVHCYTPASDQWQSFAIDDPWERDHTAVVAYRDEIWLLGGRGHGIDGNNGVTIFNPETGTSREGPPMRRMRSGFPVGVVHDRIVVAGGELLFPLLLISAAEVYHPDEGWQEIAPLPVGTHGAGGAVVDGDFHVLAGSVAPGVIVGTNAVQRLRVPLTAH
jgi:hypothetical protein